MASKVVLVSGSNGISGSALNEAIGKTPRSEWISITSVSRRPPQLEHKDDRITHISIDLLNQSAANFASDLCKNSAVDAAHAFNFIYIKKAAEKELIEVNKTIFEKILGATVEVCKKLEVFQL